MISPRRHRVVARPGEPRIPAQQTLWQGRCAATSILDSMSSTGVSKSQEAYSQPLRSRSTSAQASTHTGSDTARAPEEVKQCIRQNFQDLRSSLEQQPPEVLYPLLSSLLKDGHKEAAAMVIDAILVSTKDTQIISLRAELERDYDPQKALQTFSEYFQLKRGDASDYLSYGRLLLIENEGFAALAALRHAAAICEPSEKFDILVDLACCKLMTYDFQGALKDLSAADTLGQLGATTLTLLGELHAKHGDAAAAISALDRALFMEPLSVSTTEQRAACKYAVGDYSGAKADLDAVISLGVDNSVTYKARGSANMQLGRFEATLTDLNQAVAKQPDSFCHYDALVCQGALHHRMSNVQHAIADLDTAHQIRPLSDSDQARSQHYLQQLAETSPAAEQTTDATNDVSNANALYRQAHVQRNNGNFAGAVAALQKAAELQPQDVRLYHECAHVHISMANYTEALQQLQALMAIDSTWDVINMLRMCSVCKNRLGRHEEALAGLSKAVEVHPRDVRVLQDRASTKAALHDYSGALTDVNTAIQLSPGDRDPAALFRRGSILYKMGQLEAALADLDKANKLRPNDDFTLRWRGYVKHDLEDWAGAVADFDDAERLEPLNGLLYSGVYMQN